VDRRPAPAFDVTPVVRQVIVDGSHVVLAAEFTGTHEAGFAGIAPPGRAVHLPYAVGYDVENDQITALRASISMDGRSRQIREG
jgi:predicted ester cyclase